MRALCLFAAAGCLLARTPAAPLTFDVASIKPSALDTQGDTTDALPGVGYPASGATLKTRITQAYEINSNQVSGGPSWFDSARFDVLARPDMLGLGQQIPERLRNLLGNRFHLVIHRETKELPVYTLVIPKNGPKLQQSEDGKSRMSGRRGWLGGQHVEIPRPASWLSDCVGLPVIDKTGLHGRYNLELKWPPQSAASGRRPLLLHRAPGTPLPAIGTSSGRNVQRRPPRKTFGELA
jgi:bla regulator protein blaR1